VRRALLVIACVLLPCSPAAASVDVAVEGTEAPGVSRLVLRAVGTETNIVFVRYEAPVFVVTSASSALIVGQGCMPTDLRAATCIGTIASVSLRGAEGTDVFNAAGVPVPVEGDGGPGDDALTGGNGINTLTGGDGVDQLTGGSQSDNLDGGGDDDWVLGRGGSDTMYGAGGDDILEAGTGGREMLVGGPGVDLLKGGTGSDSVQGGTGDDVLLGATGSDTLAPGTGEDTVIGLGAADRLDCPSKVVDGEIKATPCAEIRRSKGRAPTAWPPAGVARATASARGEMATPVVAGNATGLQVHVPAQRWRTVTRCVRTYAGRTAFRPYKAKFMSKYWPTVRRPAPNRLAQRAQLTSARSCR
jgi:hypothetical protein